MQEKEFLPLGSIVIIHGAVKKLLIIQRAVQVKNEGQPKYFDYGAIPYPEGLVDDQVIYFKQAEIERLVFEGFSDNDNQLMVDQIHEALKQYDDDGNFDPFQEVREVQENE